MTGVKPLPAYVWQAVQLVAPVWFITAEVQAVPMVWQLPQVVLVIGATVCALAPLVGTPVAEVPLWQVVQLPAGSTPLCANEVGIQALVV